ncbi:fatty acid kinase catalytic subunit FakA [Mammaliicoccus sciuri]|uniref:fatty acid kinase catalytic subunit FakA n=1 Tax=Mammaliicoccus sciuri TaxID=1296 RepID=UPI001E56B0AA|nr:fatty acid kinase catalytic subunit FakA [Mammaliicoccus sciuri]MCD3219831.1 fatty acid kinase catalytic subunit FakA [Mammaliicoccus sciuri]
MNKIDGKLFADMIVQGSDSLSNNADFVDSLNVFPVPDGDTGTNMNLSMSSGAAEVKSHSNAHIGEVGKIFSKGLLMGARGNSGVILSQLFRGFSKSIENEQEIDAQQFAKAFQSGVNTAYKAVMKPVEGTILTVARVAGEAAVKAAESTEDVIKVMEAVIEEGQKALENTPNQLPVLKEVGVVDSGGQGLMFVYEGFLATLKGEKIQPAKEKVDTDEFINDDHDFGGVMNTEDIVYGYCTEIMVRFGKDKKVFDEEQFREDMSQFGDSLLVISDDEIVKVHVHSETPGEVLSYGSQYGELIKIKIENMREQHREVLRKSADKKIKQEQQQEQEAIDTAVITISMGEGITTLFKSLGATHVISGGQTMNPSTEDIVKVVKQSGCKNAIILPNNKNIIMAAEQVEHLVDIPVAVVASKTVSQGLSAMLNLNLEQSIEENKAHMEDAMRFVKSGSVTYAVRDTNIDGITIKKGEFMGIHESSIKVSDADYLTASKKLIDEMIDEDSEILTIIKGEDATDEEVDQLVSYVEENYDEVEVEVHQGDQPIYSFLFSVE